MTRRAAWPLLLIALVFIPLRFVHLDADFPPNITTSRTLYTDEGWYAINSLAIGRHEPWYQPGELNTMVSLPVVPLLQGGIFRVFGTGLVPARSLSAGAAGVLVIAVALLGLELSTATAAALAALLSVDFLLFAYSRLAVNDTVAAALAVLALLVASRRWTLRPGLEAGAAGLLLGCAILAKTTAVCAAPPLAYLYFSQSATPRRTWAPAAIALITCAVVAAGYHAWSVYLLPLDHAKFGTAPTTRAATGLLTMARNFLIAVLSTLRAEPVAALVALGGTCVLIRRSASFRATRLVRMSVIWLLSFWAMLSITAYQPSRYFVMALPPIYLLVGAVLLQAAEWLPERRTTLAVRTAVIGGLLLLNGSRIAGYLSAPKYSFRTMAQEVGAIVDRPAPGHAGVLIGDMAPSIALAANIRGVDLAEARWDVASQAAVHCPTHYITLGTPGEQEFLAISALFRVAPLGTWDVFENYYRRRGVRLFGLEPRAPQAARCGQRP